MLERICKPDSIGDLLLRLYEHEKKTGNKSIVVHVQNKALGGYYDVIPAEPKPELRKWHGCDIYLEIFTMEDLLKMQGCLKDARYAAREVNDKVVCALASVKKAERIMCPHVDMSPPWNHYLNFCGYAPHQSLESLPKTAEITPEELIKRAEKK